MHSFTHSHQSLVTHLGGEEGRGGELVLHEGALHHILVARHGGHEARGEELTGIGLHTHIHIRKS